MRLTKTVGLVRAIATAAFVFACAPLAHGQGVEIAPFGGYRFGGDFYELVTGRPIDVDGAPAVGVVVDVPLWEGLQVEGLFTHQDATITTPAGPLGGPTRWAISVDHWQGGGLQEFGDGRQVRPFLTGMLGLTRYAAEADSEIRFTVGAGGGVKLFPTPHAGLRLDGRLFATFVDADVGAFACSSAGCLTAVAVNVVWQAEFTAGVVLKFD